MTRGRPIGYPLQRGRLIGVTPYPYATDTSHWGGKALISRTLLPDVNHLIVPDDSRVPKFAFESSGRGEDDDLLVVFEDGTIGSLGDPEKSYLRSGSSYTMMFRNVKSSRANGI